MTPNQHLASLVVPERNTDSPYDNFAIGYNKCREELLARINALTPVVLTGCIPPGSDCMYWSELHISLDTHRLLTFQELLTPIAPKDERVSVEEVTKMREDIHVHGINHINALDMCNLLRRIERHGIKTEGKP